ncbi:MAG: hypothetical protein D6729_17910 [Deltaproteobacteria bacterium]|nr:MAG: hypothetical protein D6729_17910 [Deltaproteobacteria bacterium]
MKVIELFPDQKSVEARLKRYEEEEDLAIVYVDDLRFPSCMGPFDVDAYLSGQDSVPGWAMEYPDEEDWDTWVHFLLPGGADVSGYRGVVLVKRAWPDKILRVVRFEDVD